MTIIRKVVSFLLYSNIFIGLCAFALSFQVGFQRCHKEALLAAAFVFFATVIEYNIHKFISLLKNEEFAHEPRYAWLNKNRVQFYIIFIGSAIGAGFTFFQLPPAAYPYIAGTALLTAMYNFPVIPTTKGIKRLRALPYAKVFVISLVWTLTTYYIPASTMGISIEDEIQIPLSRFLFLFAVTLPFDIRDVDQDKRRGIITIPTAFGIKNSYRITVAVASITMIYALMISGSYGWSLFAGSAMLILFVLKEGWKFHPFYYYGMLDGLLLITPVFDLVLTEYFI